MSEGSPHFAVYPGGEVAHGDKPPGREFQELWFTLSRKEWASVVLVPADHGGSAADIATALAEVGTRLRDTPVTAIVANRMDYASARVLADLQPRLHDGGAWPASVNVAAQPVSANPPARPSNGTVHQATLFPPMGRAIIAIQPVVDEPLGVAVAQAADAVVLCVKMGKAQLKAARRTVELIGAARVIGTVLVP